MKLESPMLPSPVPAPSVATADSEHEEHIPEDVPWWQSYRLWFSVLACFGFFNVYAMRVNLSVAVVPMASDLDWSGSFQGVVLSSFFYGYIITQVPGGCFAEAYGGKWVLFAAILGTALLTLATPAAAKSRPAIIMLRVLEGLFEGMSYPAMHALFGKFAPPLERTLLTTITYSGAYLGSAIAQPVCGYLCHHFGWPSVFYVFGAVGSVWCVLWALLGASAPHTCPLMSAREKRYIGACFAAEARRMESSEPLLGGAARGKRGEDVEGVSAWVLLRQWFLATPWRSILTSTAVWAIIIAHATNNTAFYMVLTCLPTYLKHVLDMDIESAGIDAALPYVCMFFVTLSVGRLADLIRRRKWLQTRTVRRLATCIAFSLCAMFLVLTGYVSESGDRGKILSLSLVSAAVASLGISMAGHNINHVDISPEYSGVLMGLSNTAGTIPGIVMPSFTDAVASSPNHHTLQEEWRTVFLVVAVVCVCGAVVYGALAKGERIDFRAQQAQRCTEPNTVHVQ